VDKEQRAEQVDMDSMALPVLLALLDSEMTPSEIARRTNLTPAKVNSILAELAGRRIVRSVREVYRHQFVEEVYQLADGEAAMATIKAKLSDSPLHLLMELLAIARRELPHSVQGGKRAGVWYSRLTLTPEQEAMVENSVMSTLCLAEELQQSQVGSETGHEPARGSYRLLVAFYEVSA